MGKKSKTKGTSGDGFFGRLKTLKWGYILFALMFLIVGVGFIAHPLQATKGVCTVVGAVGVIFSLIYVIMTLADKARGFRFWSCMVMAAFGVITGIVVIILSCTGHGNGVFRILVLILAVYMIVDGSFKLQTVILSRRYKFWMWWVLLIFVIAAIVMGVFALYNGSEMKELIVTKPKLLPRLVGVGFVIDSFLNFASVFFLYKIERGQRDDVIRDLQAKGMIATIETVTEDTVVPKKKSKQEKIAAPKKVKENKKRTADIVVSGDSPEADVQNTTDETEVVTIVVSEEDTTAE